ANNPQSKRVFDLAVQLEGTIRSHGVHAAGVVIAPDELVKFAPLEMAQKGVVATQYSMGPVEELGLLKMDFLGLSNLTTINNAQRIIKKVYGDDIDLGKLALNDQDTFKLLQAGDTTGVFQLESSGMKRYLKELKPTVFEDIVAMVALYRPGPMQWIDDFIARKNGQKQIEYLHPAMENALKTTYGVIIYQEQVMQISKEMCGFTGGQADTLRKAIGKKNPETLKKLKADFIEGAIKTVGADRNLMDKFWAQLEDFAAYCFNKAHAACYGLISYQTAYLKAHYPAAYMAALMTSDYDDTDRLAIEITECKHMGIEVLPPDVNQSFLEFAVVPGSQQIRFGLQAVKNVGTAAVEEILRARQEGGNFNSLEEFLALVNNRVVNRKALESLIKAGAFDQLSDRSLMLGNLDAITGFSSRLQRQADSGQTDLFADGLEVAVVTPSLVLDPAVPQFNLSEQLQWERELLGLYLSQHPLSSYQDFLREQAIPLGALLAQHDGKSVTVAGAITELREIVTKTGQKMAFIKLADMTHELELILFPGAYQQTVGIWQRDKVVLVRGRVNARDRDGNPSDEVKVMVNDAREVTLEQALAYQATGKDAKVPKPSAAKAKKAAKSAGRSDQDGPQASLPTMERLYIRLDNSNDQILLLSLKQAIDQQPGDTEVVLVLGQADDRQIVKLPTKTEPTAKLIKELSQLVGADKVKLQ
ncbi:MAG: DNA polymerase III subunit alpha, partial [Candidatus Saccharimonadales bacterium]